MHAYLLLNEFSSGKKLQDCNLSLHKDQARRNIKIINLEELDYLQINPKNFGTIKLIFN